MTTPLALPLDDWVAAAARPVQLDVLNASCEPGTRRDYSNITPEDAFPLLIQACRTRFGNLEGLDFNTKQSPGPLAYSATLTITGPDEIGIEFPHSGYHATRTQAKMHAAHRAVQQGAIEFVMQSDAPEPAALAKPTNSISAKPPPPASAQTTEPIAPTVAPIPPNPAPAPNTKSIPPWSAPQARPPINLINSVLQKAYNSHKVPLSRTSQTWDLPPYMNGVAARLTIKLPSGKKQSYGTLPGDNSTNGARAKRPQVYPSTKVAKEAVAALAIESGVLDWIRAEELPTVPSTRKPLAALESARRTDDVPLPSYNQAGPSNQAQPPEGLPPKPTFLPAAPPKDPPTQSQPAGGPDEAYDRMAAEMINLLAKETELRHARIPTQNSTPISPVEEAQAVDELLGSPVASRATSPGPEVVLIPKKPVPKEGTRSLNVEEEDEQSVAMDLETDAGSLTRAASIVSNLGRRASGEIDRVQEAEVEEPPRKKQRTEAPDSLVGKSLGSGEAKIMEGDSYSKILSGLLAAPAAYMHTEPVSTDYCLEYGRPQPQVTYQRHRVDATDEGPVNYHVSLVVGNARYELSKNYEKVQEAEEKLSKRILKLFGVKPKRVRADEV
ncbi:hypothetical protein BDV93DRAFT_324154 [Ceratobasidium sp. AG-I]|nr:hypothetical protein BDV93DRAFT_324154 [Ceratobasidium sp. AG-I]